MNHEQQSMLLARIAARYLERGLGFKGAMNRTMDVATFAAGRSEAISLLSEWERALSMDVPK